MNCLLSTVLYLSSLLCIFLVTPIQIANASAVQANTYLSDSALPREDREPEAATGYYQKKAVKAKKFMVVSANPYATQAGFNILKIGGSAVDAAIAVQLVLTLVEPQSSGIGGGAFMLHWDNIKQHLTTFDGRETAPELITSNEFLDDNGKPIPWMQAVVGGRAVGAPGVLSALELAHKKYGEVAWEDLFVDAIALAENGFVVSPRLAKLVSMQVNPGMVKLPEIKRYFYPNGEAVKAGDILKNKALAKVYKSLAHKGIKPFYDGWISTKIIHAVKNSAIAPGKLSLQDLKQYKPAERNPVCGPYKSYKVCGMGPPTSGGISVIQILGMLEAHNLAKYTPTSWQHIHLFTQSSRLAFADRGKHIADEDFVTIPISGLLSNQYLKQRSSLISLNKDMGKALAGQPEGALVQASNQDYDIPSTTHLSIIDAQGNAVSMTSSVEMAFGSAIMVEGFILNNQLTDFSFRSKHQGLLIANRVEPLKRPRSSMAPTMVFNSNNRLKTVIGAPGGSRIINYVAQTLVANLENNLSIQDAIDLPKVTNRNKVTTLEKGRAVIKLRNTLESLGHKVSIRDLNSGLHAIDIDISGVMHAGVDKRREGLAMGE